MKMAIIVLIALLVCFHISSTCCHAKDTTTVEGLIESITGDSIRVRGKYYLFTDVPLIDPSGKHIPKSQLKVGRKVQIFFQKKSVDTILIYPEFMLE